jgi:hypothetical protein
MTAIPRPGRAGLAQRLTMAWVRLYTAGMPPNARARRSAEVESDLWEHAADRQTEGADPAAVGLETMGRVIRGVPADLLWRFQLEGPKVQIHIPIERIAGAFLLILVAAMLLSTNVSGYDPSRDGFDGELRRLASIEGWQVSVYVGLQVLAGIGMLGAAVVLCLALRPHSATTALFAAVFLAAAGLVTLVTSAVYSTAAELADDYVAAGPQSADSVLTVARGYVLVMSTLVPVTILMLALGVHGFALITARHRLAPRWLGYVAAVSAASLLVGVGLEIVSSGDTVSWLMIMAGLVLLLVWLVVAGGWLLFGGAARRLPAPVVPAPPLPGSP